MYQHDDSTPRRGDIAGPTSPGTGNTSVKWAELDYRYQVEAYKSARAAAKFDDVRGANDCGKQPRDIRPDRTKDTQSLG